MSILKKGSKGSAVEDLQKKLNKANPKPKPPLTEDGDFGSLTDKAVRKFQLENGWQGWPAYICNAFIRRQAAKNGGSGLCDKD